ncbi:MAG: NAD(P)/FAD-dependent oxidoreductase [Simkaniaceae bacterium]|nr:NAD(P)/FAD-dependent oxidoreductase [Simkaniaceae bacterium]
MKIVVIGGGAAGFFAALNAKQQNPAVEVIILEKTAKLLSKVKISGGGRCNVTHACFEPATLIQNYPRGKKELLGPFHKFQPRDMIAWLKEHGVELKTEKDGRMFPITNSSSTIIDCFLSEAKKLGIAIWTESKLRSIHKKGDCFELDIGQEKPLHADRVIMATGSSKAGWDFAKEFGHIIVPPVASLFTFNVPNFSLKDLSGASVTSAKLQIKNTKFTQTGPLLITHFGFSGPAALKLSAWAARYLAENKYEAFLQIDWLPDLSTEEVQKSLEENRCKNVFLLPKKLWKALLLKAGAQQIIHSKSSLLQLLEVLKKDTYKVSGKTINKEEFVTCGGITLSEVNFKTMESKLCKNVFFAGEILDIDGVTGGFNFQNAWTTGYIAGLSAALSE